MNRIMPALALVACGGGGGGGHGDWRVTVWGEAYIEEGIPSEAFEDGCSVTFSKFSISVGDVALLDGDGEPAESYWWSNIAVWDLVEPGPIEMSTFRVPATTYDTVRFAIRQEAPQAAIQAEGALTCGADTVTFAWSFPTATTYLCEPSGLTIPNDGEAGTELTIHGDHLFYDGLENDDAAVRGQAIVDADANNDGTVTHEELAAVGVAGLGYQVGQYSTVVTLDDFVTHLSRTIGHIDGEGHCQADL